MTEKSVLGLFTGQSTLNIERRMGRKGISSCSTSSIRFLALHSMLDVRRSMFDVHLSKPRRPQHALKWRLKRFPPGYKNEEEERAMLPKRRLGKTDMEITIMGLGGEGILRTYDHEDQAYRLINRAIDLGINYFESARAYSGSEAYYGLALKESPMAETRKPPWIISGRP
jgi:hypothetical protein